MTDRKEEIQKELAVLYERRTPPVITSADNPQEQTPEEMEEQAKIRENIRRLEREQAELIRKESA